jgi:hypothetical protein
MNPVRDARHSPTLFSEIPVKAEISTLVRDFDEK